MTLSSQDFGLTEFIDALDAESIKTREFTTYTGEDDDKVTKRILAPLQFKIVWK